MENSSKMKGSKGVAIIVCLFILIVEIGATALKLLEHMKSIADNTVPIAHDIVNILVCLLVLYYVLWGFKVAHGNILRAVYFIFSVNLIVLVVIPKPESSTLLTVAMFCVAFAALIEAYIAGRLDKIAKNKNLLIIAGILLICSSYMSMVNRSFEILRVLTNCEALILHVALAVTYIVRYDEHKNAN